MTRNSDNFEVLVDIPGLTLVRVDGTMQVDIVDGFRTREEAIAILSEFGDVDWPDDD
jgi:predicted CoA-binding protein